jgi:hypothetical protein
MALPGSQMALLGSQMALSRSQMPEYPIRLSDHGPIRLLEGQGPYHMTDPRWRYQALRAEAPFRTESPIMVSDLIPNRLSEGNSA